MNERDGIDQDDLMAEIAAERDGCTGDTASQSDRMRAEAAHAAYEAEQEQADGYAEALAEADLAHWDDDPSPYSGTYSEDDGE